MICWSTSEFIFSAILAGRPASCASIVLSTSSISGLRIHFGATSAGSTTFVTSPWTLTAWVPAAAIVAPTIPPISACDELDGRP